MFYVSSVRSKKHSTTAGFSLVELLISISIIAIVSAIVLSRQSAFNGAVLLRSQAYEIALQLRDVQLTAVSAEGDGAGSFRSVLGVHFDDSNSTDDRFVVFRDSDVDGFYDAGEEIGVPGQLDPRFEIRDIRVIGSDSLTGTAVSVIYVRPNFDARFFDDGGGASNELDVSSVEIDIARRDATGTGPGDVRTVEITSTGQIAVLDIP